MRLLLLCPLPIGSLPEAIAGTADLAAGRQQLGDVRVALAAVRRRRFHEGASGCSAPGFCNFQAQVRTEPAPPSRAIDRAVAMKGRILRSVSMAMRAVGAQGPMCRPMLKWTEWVQVTGVYTRSSPALMVQLLSGRHRSDKVLVEQDMDSESLAVALDLPITRSFPTGPHPAWRVQGAGGIVAHAAHNSVEQDRLDHREHLPLFVRFCRAVFLPFGEPVTVSINAWTGALRGQGTKTG